MSLRKEITFFGFKPMFCPECLTHNNEALKTKCLETRTFLDEADDQPMVIRRHRCLECGFTFQTIEKPV